MFNRNKQKNKGCERFAIRRILKVLLKNFYGHI
jgi:hypothetical protein